jgi:chromosome partitioning protein
MIDLDYQGSLTSLVLPGTDLHVAAAERRLAQDFFLAGARRGELRRYVHRLTGLTEALAVLPATDPLADVEAWLMARWLIRPQEGDVRFALRAALHNPDEAGEFDRVLIDCPPRLTTACVNALACCDYVLVPVNLDRTSALAAPRLLGLLRQLQPALMPALGGVGLVANRVSRSPLAAGERDSWNDLADQCRDAWGWPVDGLPTAVPQSVAFRNAANRGRLAVNETKEMGEIFTRLADELNERVPCESRRASSVPR